MRHLACIMDGNRRWAQQHGLVPWQGHKKGIDTVRRIISFCLEKNISYLSLYVFSIENFSRSDEEKSFLFNILAHEAFSELSQLKEQGVRVRFIGDRELFPSHLRSLTDTVELETKSLSALHLNLLFCYGGRQELVTGIKKIVQDVKDGRILVDSICQEVVSRYLWTDGIPDPDIIVRSGGMQRLSNFLLYQAAYSELYFLDCFWPDIQKEHLEKIMKFFNQSKRNFGS